jgi:hypothetical protein
VWQTVKKAKTSTLCVLGFGLSALETRRLLVAEVSLAPQAGFRRNASLRTRPALLYHVSVISSARPLLGILAAFTPRVNDSEKVFDPPGLARGLGADRREFSHA